MGERREPLRRRGRRNQATVWKALRLPSARAPPCRKSRFSVFANGLVGTPGRRCRVALPRARNSSFVGASFIRRSAVWRRCKDRVENWETLGPNAVRVSRRQNGRSNRLVAFQSGPTARRGSILSGAGCSP